MICYFILMYDLDNNIRSYRNNNFDSAIEIFVWTNIERGELRMTLTSKFIEAALAISFPKIEEIKNNRIKELIEMKSKIKEDPTIVENWFDNEINKIINVTENNSSINIESLIKNLK
jgi:hypothetical protein